MIPTHTQSGVLPPFIGCGPTDKASVSPYLYSIGEFASRFCSSRARAELLAGFLEYRTELRSIGIREGFQWVDGSYLENCEAIRGSQPRDIDVVTVARRPPEHSGIDEWRVFIGNNKESLLASSAKRRFRCDAYFIDLDSPSEILIRDVYYWYGLFSHQRATALWKGMVEIPLLSDEDRASEIVQEIRDAQKT